MYEKVHGTEHHLAAKKITTPGEGNELVPLRHTEHIVLAVLKKI